MPPSPKTTAFMPILPLGLASGWPAYAIVHGVVQFNREQRREAMPFGPLTTTSVGSFPRPTWLAHTRRNQLTYRLDGDELKEAMDDAMALVIREQEQLGLDILTDGEMRRTSFVFHIAGRWDGVDIERQVNKQIYRNREAN